MSPQILPRLFKRHGGGDDDEEHEEHPGTDAPVSINGTTTTQTLGSSSLSSSSSFAQGNVNLAFGLVGIAALFGFIGSLLGVYIPKYYNSQTKKFLSGSLSLSGGILVFLSLTDILGEARAEFRKRPSLIDRKHATTLTLGLFLAGIVVYMLIKLVSKRFMPHHSHDTEDLGPAKGKDTGSDHRGSVDTLESGEAMVEKAGLKSSAIEIAVTLALHNIPEGIILFTSTLANKSIGINLAIGLIFHKLPEGLIIAMPFYAATKSVWKSLLLAFVASSFFLFVGAVLSYVVFTNYWNPFAGGCILAVTSGVLFWLGVSVVLPLANKMDPEGKVTPFGILAGVFVICLSSSVLSYA
jgi:ZIP family zinc transporter